MECVTKGDVIRCFQCVSNEMNTTKIIVCPEDINRTYAKDFNTLTHSNISYFIGVDVTNEANPGLVLDGDDNLELNGTPVKPGLLNLSTSAAVTWIPGRHDNPDRLPYLDIPTEHHFYGNLGFADGSVAMESSSNLQTAFLDAGLATNRLAIP